MKITRRQLVGLIRKQLLSEAYPGVDGMGLAADAFTASVKANPNNPEKWDKQNQE